MRQARAQLLAASCLIIGAIIMQAAHAVPLPGNNQELDLLQIPLANGKEIDVLTLGAKDQEQLIADRNKRTIGLLRELFPDITKQIDDQANRIISKILRTLGPTVLRTAIQGNAANRARTNFDADFDDDDDNSTNSTSTTSSSSNGTRVTIELPTFEPEDDDDNKVVDDKEDSSSTSTSSTTTSTTTTTTTTEASR